MTYPNNKNIELVDFFPVSRKTRVKETAKKSIWPFVIGAVCASAVAIGMVIASGGLSIPGLAIHAAMQGVLKPLVTKLVISLCRITAFGLGFGIAKYLGIGAPKLKMHSFEKMPYDNDHMELPVKLKMSRLHENYITHYHKYDDTVLISVSGNEAGPYPRSHMFIPLKNEFEIISLHRNVPMRVTHYCEHRETYKVYYPRIGEEKELSYAAVELIRSQQQGNSHTSRPTKLFIHTLDNGSLVSQPNSSDSLTNRVAFATF